MTQDTHDPTPPPPPEATAMPRWRVLRIVALVLLAMVLTTVLVVAGAIAAWNSEAGTRWLLAHLPGITAVDVQGTLGRGELRVGSLRAIESNVQVDIDGLHVQGLRLAFRPVPGVWLGVRMDTWEAASVRVALRANGTPSSGPAAPPASLRSPVSLAVEHLRAGRVTIGGAPPLRDVSARLELGADEGRVHRVDGLQLTWEKVAATGHLLIHADAPMDVDAALTAHDAPAAVAQASSSSSSSSPGTSGPQPQPQPTAIAHWAADVSLAGPLKTLGVSAHLRGENASGSGPEVDLQARVAPFDPLPLSSITATTRDLDLASLTNVAPTTRLSGRLVLATSRPAVADIDLVNAVPKAWSAGGLPVAHVVARVEAPWNAESLALPALTITLADDRAPAGEVHAQGSWVAGSAQLQVDLADVQPGRLDDHLGAWRISGPLRIDTKDVPAPSAMWASDGPAASAPKASPPPWSAHVTARLAGTMPPLQSGQRAPAPPPLALTLDAKTDGKAFDIGTLALQAGTATASAKASLARAADGAWRGSAHAQWAQFDPDQWIRLADAGPLHDGANRLTGALDVTLQEAPIPWRGIESLRGHAELTLTNSQLAGLPLEGRATITAGASPWALASEWHSGPNTAHLEATVAPEALQTSVAASLRHVHLQADLPAIAELRPLSPQRWPNTGQAHADLVADGAGPAWQALAAGNTATASGPMLALTSEGDATGWAGDNVRLDALHWSVHVPGDSSAPVTAEVTLHEARWGPAGIANALARLSGTAADHTLHVEADAPLSPPEWLAGLANIEAANGTHLDTTLQGHWQHAGPDVPAWQGHLAGLTLRAVSIGRSASAPASATISTSSPMPAPSATTATPSRSTTSTAPTTSASPSSARGSSLAASASGLPGSPCSPSISASRATRPVTGAPCAPERARCRPRASR